MSKPRDRGPNRVPPGLDWPVLLCGLVAPLLVAVLFVRDAWRLPDDTLRDAILVRDAVNLWVGGTLARAGHIATAFDPVAYWRAAQAMFGDRFPLHTWGYPPPMLLLAVPLSLLPVVPAFLVWSAAAAALFWLGARAAGLSRVACTVAVASPAALENVLGGQNGALSAALLLPGLILLDIRPWVAGVLLGGLILKPHLAVLVPVCLLASWDRRAAAGACASASVLVASSTLAFGWRSWAGFMDEVMPFMRHEVLEAAWFSGPYQPMLATPFMAARWAGAPIQAVCAGVAVSLCWRVWRDRAGADALARAAVTLALTFLATPYGYSYDMVALAAALIGLAVRDGPWRGEARWLFAVAWIWPGYGYLLGVLEQPPLGLAAVACAAVLGWRACQRGRARPGTAALGVAAG